MKVIIRISTALLFLLIFVSSSSAANEKTNQEISNRMILEKLELFQSLKTIDEKYFFYGYN